MHIKKTCTVAAICWGGSESPSPLSGELGAVIVSARSYVPINRVVGRHRRAPRTMALHIPWRNGVIRVYTRKKSSGYEPEKEWRASFYKTGTFQKGSKTKRLWGAWATSIRSTVTSLLAKMKLAQRDKDAVLAAIPNARKTTIATEDTQPAMSQESPSQVVYFESFPWEGRVRIRTRPGDSKVRMALSRSGHERICSNWHTTSQEAFEFLQHKCETSGIAVPAMSQKNSSKAGVHFVHQIYGLYRDGKPMSALFKLSAYAWEGYALRHRISYKLWTADELDTLIQLEADDWIQELYRDVKDPVQRADVGRFFILYKYGGLYADLDTFPNIERYPLVPLGLCKMQCRATKAMRKKLEWEIEVVVAEAGNQFILKLLRDMSMAMGEKSKLPFYLDKPCRFIYNTTGPKLVAQSLKKHGYEPDVTVFKMCRPVPDLDKHITVHEGGRVHPHWACMSSFDVLSAFSMSYNTKEKRAPPPLAMPNAQLPPLTLEPKRRRYWSKTKFPGSEREAMAPPLNRPDEGRETGCEPQASMPESNNTPRAAPCPTSTASGSTVYYSEGEKIENGYKPQAALSPAPTELDKQTTPGSGNDEPVQHGYEPEGESLSSEAREAFEDMVKLFLTQRKCVSVNVCYNLLDMNTRAYLRSRRSELQTH